MSPLSGFHFALKSRSENMRMLTSCRSERAGTMSGKVWKLEKRFLADSERIPSVDNPAGNYVSFFTFFWVYLYCHVSRKVAALPARHKKWGSGWKQPPAVDHTTTNECMRRLGRETNVLHHREEHMPSTYFWESLCSELTWKHRETLSVSKRKDPKNRALS